MSTIRRLKTDAGATRYEVRWDAPGRDGARVQRKRRFSTRKAAEDFLHRSKAEEQRGRITPDARSTVTVSEAIDKWLDEKAKDELRPTYLDNLTVSLRTHVAPRSIGRMRVIDVRAEHVVALYRDVRDHGLAVGHGPEGRCRTAGVTCNGFKECSPAHHRGLSAKSRLHVHGALRGMFAWLIEENVIALNPCVGEKVKRSLPERASEGHRVTEEDYWTPDEARAFLTSCRTTNDPLTIVWQVALATGLRRAELAGLLWRYVDLDAGLIRVRRSTTAVRGRAVTTEGKGKAAGKTHAAHRDVPIGPTTVALLRAHKIAQAPGATHVFTDAEGEAIHPDRMSKRFTAAAKRAGLHRPGLGVHSLRHHAITSWLREGVPVTTVAKIAGHENASITLIVYAHAVPDDDRRTAEASETTLHAPVPGTVTAGA